MTAVLREKRGVVPPQRVYQYTRRGVEEVIKRLQSPTGIIVEGHLLRVFRDQGFDIDPVRDNKSVYSPDALYDALSFYVERDCHYDSKLLARAIDACYSVFAHHPTKLKLKSLEFDFELYSAIKLDKASGAPLFMKKGDAYELDNARAKKIARMETAPPPCIAYHRVQHGPEGPKTRLVWGYPLSMTLLEARFARPLIKRFLEIRTPMTFGLVKNEVGARVLETSRHGVVYGLDFSKFDSSIPTRLIMTAFEILKTHFDMSSEDEGVWRIVRDYFINTLILMPDGFVYQKHCGVPSGSYFTQLVDSIVNYIIIQYMVLVVTGEMVDNRLINVLGDDSLFRLSGWYETQDFANVAASLGMTINVPKSGRYRREDPSFLGHTWHLGIPNRPELELVKRIIFPERPSQISKSVEDHQLRQVERLIAYIGDASDGWKLIYNSGLLGKTNDIAAYQLLGRRTRYPITDRKSVV